MNDSIEPRGYRFGIFEVDRVTGELWRSGVKVRLQGKPFDLLLALLESGGDLVTRETLHERLWPGTIVDFEGSLNAAIKRLRETLQDSAETPRYIETIPRRGYRLLTPVETIAARAEKPRVETGERAGAAASNTADPTTAPSPSAGDASVAPATPMRSHRAMAIVSIVMTVIAIASLVSAVVLSRRKASAPAVKHRLLVLPFENLDADSSDVYFSAGLTEEMITQLGRLSPDQLGVIARTTAMQYQGRPGAIAEARREHGVDYVLEGAVRRERGHVRVSAKLIDAASETQRWAANFDRDMKDVLRLQSDLALEIAGALAIELLPSTSRRLAASQRVDPRAFEATLKGRYLWAQQTGEGFRGAGAAFYEAIALDSTYAPAWAGLASTWAMVGNYDFVRPREAFTQARAAAEKALALDPDLADAHAVMGLIQCAYDWDCEAGEQSLRRAVALDPNDALARQWLAGVLDCTGHADEALAHLEAARQIDPLSRILLSDIGWHSFYGRHYDQAIAQFQAVLELDPNFLVAHDNLSWAYFMKGDYPSYIEHVCRALELGGDAPDDVRRFRESFARLGWRERRKKSAMGMARDAAKEYVSPYDIALEWAAYGDHDQAIHWLQKSVEQREVDLVGLRFDPRMDVLRGDPRFDAILAQIVPRRPS